MGRNISAYIIKCKSVRLYGDKCAFIAIDHKTDFYWFIPCWIFANRKIVHLLAVASQLEYACIYITN